VLNANANVLLSNSLAHQNHPLYAQQYPQQRQKVNGCGPPPQKILKREHECVITHECVDSNDVGGFAALVAAASSQPSLGEQHQAQQIGSLALHSPQIEATQHQNAPAKMHEILLLQQERQEQQVQHVRLIGPPALHLPLAPKVEGILQQALQMNQTQQVLQRSKLAREGSTQSPSVVSIPLEARRNGAPVTGSVVCQRRREPLVGS
jgi:hypothetical protein